MARTTKIRWLRIVVCHHSCRDPPLISRNTCSSILVINGYCKCRTMIVCIFCTHLRKIQFISILLRHRHTDQSLSITCHKIYIFQCSKLCRTDHIPFIFPILVIHHHNNLSLTKIFQHFFNGIKLCFHNPLAFLFVIRTHIL